jgi:hypothetical protein
VVTDVVVMANVEIIMMTALVVMVADMDMDMVVVDTDGVMIVGKGNLSSEMYVLYKKKPK